MRDPKSTPADVTRPQSPRASLTAHEQFDAALDVLAAISNTPGRRMRASDLARDLSITEAQLEEIISLIQTLADRATGARVVITNESGMISLLGDAGIMAPMRLTPDEGAVVQQVLTRHRLDPDVRSRIERALGSVSNGGAQLATHMAADPMFGGFYQTIIEALQDGARLALTYRSLKDNQPRERLVDPGFIELGNEAAYLLAWDVTADEQRRYRLDRISDARVTDDSVTRHPFTREAVHDALARGGQATRLRFASRQLAEQTGWAGIDFEHGAEDADGSFIASVFYTDETWLFDHILAAGGAITILEPRELTTQLSRRASELLIPLR